MMGPLPFDFLAGGGPLQQLVQVQCSKSAFIVTDCEVLDAPVMLALSLERRELRIVVHADGSGVSISDSGKRLVKRQQS